MCTYVRAHTHTRVSKLWVSLRDLISVNKVEVKK